MAFSDSSDPAAPSTRFKMLGRHTWYWHSVHKMPVILLDRVELTNNPIVGLPILKLESTGKGLSELECQVINLVTDWEYLKPLRDGAAVRTVLEGAVE